MGRASNRKWAKRITRWMRATAADRLVLHRLFGRHRKFKVS